MARANVWESNLGKQYLPAKNKKIQIFLKYAQMKLDTSLILFAIEEKHINDFISHEENKKKKRSVPSFEDLETCDH